MPSEITVAGEPLAYAMDGPTVLFTFKTVMEPHSGRATHLQGDERHGGRRQDLVNDNTGATERINQLFIMEGKERKPVDRNWWPAISGCTMKLKDTGTGHTLHAKGKADQTGNPSPSPSRVCGARCGPARKRKSASIPHCWRLQQEDPTIRLQYNRETSEQLLGTLGEQHLNLLEVEIGRAQYKLSPVFGSPRTAYRETIRKPAEAMYRHKKQSGGSGQFGEVHLHIEPWYEGMPEPAGVSVRSKETLDLATGGKLEFCNCTT
jgi:elongation factor G